MRRESPAAPALSHQTSALMPRRGFAFPYVALITSFIVSSTAWAAEVTPNWISAHRVGGVPLNELSAVALDSQGNIWATGVARSSAADSKVLVLKLDAGGVIQWAQTYDASAGGQNFGTDIAVNAAGEGIVASTMTTALDNLDLVALRLTATGQVADSFTYDSGNSKRDEGAGVALAPDGTPYLTGVVDRAGVNGTILKQWVPGGWQHIWDNSNPRPPYVDASNQIYLLDEFELGTINFTIRLAKFSSAGAQLWERLFDFEDVDRAVALAVDPNGEVYGVANSLFTFEETTTFSIGVVKYGPASQFRWFQILAPGGGAPPKEARAAVVDANGNLYVTGSVENQLLVMKVSTFGFMEWERRELVGSGQDIAIAPDGTIIAVGRSTAGAIIAAYNAGGGLLYDSAYSGAFGEAANLALAITPDGSPVAVGSRRAAAGQVDAMAIRYQVCNTTCQTQPGDANCDGFVTVADIGAFVLALTQPAQYVATFPDCQVLNADTTNDDAVSVSDIGPFVALLTGG